MATGGLDRTDSGHPHLHHHQCSEVQLPAIKVFTKDTEWQTIEIVNRSYTYE
jgi:hypothetical protein